MIGGMGTPELILLLGITVVVFGAGRIPEIAKSMGKGIKEFKKASKEIAEDIDDAVQGEPDEKKD